MERREFIKNCITGCAWTLLAAGSYVNLNKFTYNLKYYRKEKFRKKQNIRYISNIEIPLSEHCNLNCKYCNHFSNIAEPGFYDFEKFKEDIILLKKVTQKQENLKNITLTGGEPLLNEKISEYIMFLRGQFPETEIELSTNGLFLDKQDNLFYKTVHETNTALIISNYDSDINWNGILKKLNDYDINKFGIYYNTAFIGEKITPMLAEETKITNFYKYNLNIKGTEKIQERFESCFFRYFMNQLKNGKIYPCPVIANVEHLNKKFNVDFKVTQNDYIDLTKVRKFKDILKFLDKPPEFCKYCGKFKESVNWEISSNPDISEWT